MHVMQARRRSHRLSGSLFLLCLLFAAMAGTFALAGCGNQAAKSNAASVKDCGTSHTAANVPIDILVERGHVSCATALAIEGSYAKAIAEGKAPGNGGGGPVQVGGWTCQGFPTPELLKTGKTSKCAKDGTEILAILKTS